jgi:hypothetical protein
MAAASEASEAARTGKADIPAKSRIRILKHKVITLEGAGHKWLPNHLGPGPDIGEKRWTSVIGSSRSIAARPSATCSWLFTLILKSIPFTILGSMPFSNLPVS